MEKAIWKSKPDKHDYPAAHDYLTLHFTGEEADGMVETLKSERIVSRKAKDILRASKLPLLSKKDVHVAEYISKVKNGEKLSPVLLLAGNPLIIADGYHRVCAIYYLSEDLELPCKIAHYQHKGKSS